MTKEEAEKIINYISWYCGCIPYIHNKSDEKHIMYLDDLINHFVDKEER